MLQYPVDRITQHAPPHYDDPNPFAGNVKEGSSFPGGKQPAQEPQSPQRTRINKAFKFGPALGDPPRFRLTVSVPELRVRWSSLCRNARSSASSDRLAVYCGVDVSEEFAPLTVCHFDRVMPAWLDC